MLTKSEVTYAFIDSQNLNLSVRNDLINTRTGETYYKGWNLNFKRFRVYLKDKYRVDKAYLFIGKVAKYQRLYDDLKSYGYHLIYKPTINYKEGEKSITKGNVDAELILHSMIQYENYNKAIVVAGDGDYHCLIEYLEQQKKLQKVIIPNRYQYSKLLNDFRQYFVFVSDLKNKLEDRNGK